MTSKESKILKIEKSIQMLDNWLIENDYKSFDPFDGLNSNVRFLTFENHLLRIFLENLIRRFPINLRPLLGVQPWFSSKGFGFLAKAYLNMYKITGDKKYFSKSRMNPQFPRY